MRSILRLEAIRKLTFKNEKWLKRLRSIRVHSSTFLVTALLVIEQEALFTISGSGSELGGSQFTYATGGSYLVVIAYLLSLLGITFLMSLGEIFFSNTEEESTSSTLTIYPFGPLIEPKRENPTTKDLLIRLLPFLILRLIIGVLPLPDSLFTLAFRSISGWLLAIAILPLPPFPGEALLIDRVYNTPTPNRKLPNQYSTGQYSTGQIVALALFVIALLSGEFWFATLLGFAFYKFLQTSFFLTAKRALSGITIREVMCPANEVDVLQHGMTVKRALKVAQRSFQDIFPVLHAKLVIGTVSRQALLKAELTLRGGEYLPGVMSRDFSAADIRRNLSDIINPVDANVAEPIVITEDGEFAGLLIQKGLLDSVFVEEYSKHLKVNVPDDDFDF
jgi:hypothetical protein